MVDQMDKFKIRWARDTRARLDAVQDPVEQLTLAAELMRPHNPRGARVKNLVRQRQMAVMALNEGPENVSKAEIARKIGAHDRRVVDNAWKRPKPLPDPRAELGSRYEDVPYLWEMATTAHTALVRGETVTEVARAYRDNLIRELVEPVGSDDKTSEAMKKRGLNAKIARIIGCSPARVVQIAGDSRSG